MSLPDRRHAGIVPSIFFLVILQVFLYVPSCLASQIPGHLFFASKMLHGPVEKFLANDSDLVHVYLQGSLGPDVLWLVSLASSPDLRTSLEKQYQIKLPGEWTKLPDATPDVHWQRSIETSINMLKSACTPKEQAYVLGWISHFIVDAHVHKLIASRVGMPTDPLDLKDPSLRAHDRLEALESRHVFSQYSSGMRLTYFDEDEPFETQSVLILRALASSFPDHSAFHPANTAVTKSMLRRAEELTMTASHWYQYQATHNQRQVERVKKLLKRFRPEQAAMLQFLTELPSKSDYELQRTASDFLVDWEREKPLILEDATRTIPLCGLYLWRQNKLSSTLLSSDEVSWAILENIELQLKKMTPTGDIR